MTVESFGGWVEFHCSLTGIRADRDLETLLIWVREVEGAGYRLAELEEASRWISVHPPLPRFLADHQTAILFRIRDARAIVAKKSEEDAQISACIECSGTGRLCVPHLRGVLNGEWRPMTVGASAIHYTMAVRCRCARGKFGRFTSTRPGHADADLMRIEDYEIYNPHWIEQEEKYYREILVWQGISR